MWEKKERSPTPLSLCVLPAPSTELSAHISFKHLFDMLLLDNLFNFRKSTMPVIRHNHTASSLFPAAGLLFSPCQRLANVYVCDSRSIAQDVLVLTS